MRLSKLIAPDLERILETEPGQLEEALSEVHAEDVAQVVCELPPERATEFTRALPAQMAADVLERLPEDLRVHIVEALGPATSAELVSEMDPDDRADLVAELPDKVREELLAEVEQQEPGIAQDVRALAAYDEESAGGLMTTEFLALWPELTVSEAIDEVRVATRERDLETIYYLYVVAYDKLVGVLSLRDLILSDGEKRLATVMTEQVVSVPADTDQEEVANTIARYDLSALPVVDQHGKMLGVVTVDDVVDVVIDEATEDAHMMAAVVPIEESYLQTGFVDFLRNRITWLIVLFAGELLTASVMDAYEAQLSAVMDLMIFVPLIISSGGNSGSQSSSLIIRALALGELAPRDWPKVLGRELAMGLALGLVLGLVGFARAFAGHGINNPAAMGMTVALAIVGVVTMGTLVGSLMPLAIKRAGLDPAVSSTPFVASLVDVFGLIVYFSIARMVFALAL
ncbi:MAG: magnesium transporter [Myxococcales bacterium]|nr:magnesium transporter [Myxococcales bacterium]MDD9966641.1 magnesium transporter [Myxococcales bacterium]